MDAALLAIVVLVALAFDFTNGFHDTANAVATSISTRALSPRVAVAIASAANLAGAFVTTAVAKTVGKGIIDTGLATTRTVLAALIGAIAWNLLTWWLGLPSSSSHALIGGLIGAAMAQSWTKGVAWHGVAHKVVIPALVAPALAFAAAYVLLLAIFWLFVLSKPYARQAAVGSFTSLTTSRPAISPASFVACLWLSLKYAGTVITAFFTSCPKNASASRFIFERSMALSS